MGLRIKHEAQAISDTEKLRFLSDYRCSVYSIRINSLLHCQYYTETAASKTFPCADLKS